MANAWFWTLISIVPVITAHKLRYSPEFVPDGNALAGEFPANQHFFELFSAKPDSFTKSIPITTISPKIGNSDKMTEPKFVPEGNAMAGEFPFNKDIFDILSAKLDYFAKSIPITTVPAKIGNSDKMTEPKFVPEGNAMAGEFPFNKDIFDILSAKLDYFVKSIPITAVPQKIGNSDKMTEPKFVPQGNAMAGEFPFNKHIYEFFSAKPDYFTQSIPITTVPPKIGKSDKKAEPKFVPEGNAMAGEFPFNKHTFDILSAKLDYFAKSIPITTVPAKNGISDKMTEHTTPNKKSDFNHVKGSSELKRKLEGISEKHLNPGNNYQTFERIHSDCNRKISQPENTKKKDIADRLTEKKNYMKQFLKISYSWSTFDENFDAAPKELGVTDRSLKMFVKALPVQETLLENENHDGDWDYNLKIKTRRQRQREYKFNLGVPVKLQSPDKRQVTSTFTLVENNVLKEEQTWRTENRNMKATLIREYSLKKMVLKVTINNVTTVHTFVAK